MISVNMVAKPNPNMIETAIGLKNTSDNKGNIPKIVVTAAIETGRKRLIAA